MKMHWKVNSIATWPYCRKTPSWGMMTTAKEDVTCKWCLKAMEILKSAGGKG